MKAEKEAEAAAKEKAAEGKAAEEEAAAEAAKKEKAAEEEDVAAKKKTIGFLTFSCRNLPTHEGEEHVDPIVGCYTTSEDKEDAPFNVSIGQTEHLSKNDNPDFKEAVEVEVPEGWKDRRLRFVVFDVDDDAVLKPSDKIAAATCNASELWAGGDVTLKLDTVKDATLVINSTWSGAAYDEGREAAVAEAAKKKEAGEERNKKKNAKEEEEVAKELNDDEFPEIKESFDDDDDYANDGFESAEEVDATAGGIETWFGKDSDKAESDDEPANQNIGQRNDAVTPGIEKQQTGTKTEEASKPSISTATRRKAEEEALAFTKQVEEEALAKLKSAENEGAASDKNETFQGSLVSDDRNPEVRLDESEQNQVSAKDGAGLTGQLASPKDAVLQTNPLSPKANDQYQKPSDESAARQTKEKEKSERRRKAEEREEKRKRKRAAKEAAAKKEATASVKKQETLKTDAPEGKNSMMPQNSLKHKPQKVKDMAKKNRKTSESETKDDGSEKSPKKSPRDNTKKKKGSRKKHSANKKALDSKSALALLEERVREYEIAAQQYNNAGMQVLSFNVWKIQVLLIISCCLGCCQASSAILRPFCSFEN